MRHPACTWDRSAAQRAVGRLTSATAMHHLPLLLERTLKVEVQVLPTLLVVPATQKVGVPPAAGQCTQYLLADAVVEVQAGSAGAWV